jgi:TolB-like protein
VLALLLLVPTVAVMPFKDLSATGKSRVGEAIRETVTTDLKDVTGLKVIERSSIDQVIAEQNLQAKKTDLDTIATVRVGTLLGATLIVTGAYQRVGEGVRLTARFVSVETGEVKGSAKVDGAAGDLLALQDRVTVQLLKSAGIGEPQQRRFVARAREKVPLRAFELYGEAVTEPDAEARKHKLELTIGASPHFDYAVRDLSALEKRVITYGDAAERARAIRNKEELEKAEHALAVAKDPVAVFTAWQQMLLQLNGQRRWHRLIRQARYLVEHPPPKPASWAGADSLAETALGLIADAYYALNDDDGVLATEEELMRRFPASRRFDTARWRVKNAIENKRKAEEGKKKIAAKLAELSPEQRADGCRVAHEYADWNLWREAIRAAESCLDTDDEKRETQALSDLAHYAYKAGDFAATRRYLQRLRGVDEAAFEKMRYLPDERMPPEDDR